jgi:hypothetical protein
MIMQNFNDVSNFNGRIVIDLCMKLMSLILLIGVYGAIKVCIVLYNLIGLYDHLDRMDTMNNHSIATLLEKNKSSIDSKSYSARIQESNQRTQFFIWMKQWCDEWLCLDVEKSGWSKISFQYDQAKKIAALDGAFDFNDMREESDFSNWLDQSGLFTHVSMLSMQPLQSIWNVQYLGEKKL